MLVLVLLIGCTSSGSETPTPPSIVDLESAIGPNPEDFAFTYRSRGTDVLDCVLPNRDFTGTVLGSGDFTIREPEQGAPLVIRIEDTTYLSGELFSDGSLERSWVSLRPKDLDRLEDAIRRSLGTDLSAYVLSRTRPATGRDIAVDAIDDATSIIPIDPIRVGGDIVAGQRLVIPGAPDDPGLVIDAWVDSLGQVTRVQVQRAQPDDPAEPNPDSGWLVDYRPLSTPPDPADPPDDVVDGATVDPGSLDPPVKRGCELEIGPDPSAPRPQP